MTGTSGAWRPFLGDSMTHGKAPRGAGNHCDDLGKRIHGSEALASTSEGSEGSGLRGPHPRGQEADLMDLGSHGDDQLKQKNIERRYVKEEMELGNKSSNTFGTRVVYKRRLSMGNQLYSVNIPSKETQEKLNNTYSKN